jgi:hypothetical protein
MSGPTDAELVPEGEVQPIFLDTTFLRVHSRTRRWWQERETCRACVHYVFGVDKHGSGGERCAAVRVRVGLTGRSGRTLNQYCIDARDEGARCGPNATLFKPKRKIQTP